MHKAILMMLLAVVSSSAAAEWLKVGGNETATAYIDPSTIRKVGNKRKIWMLFDFNVRQNEAKSHKSQNEFDCMEEQSRILYISAHTENMGRGSVVSSSNVSDQWRPIAPDIMMHALLELFCK